MWPALTILAFAALVALHFWWQAKLRRERAAWATARARAESLERAAAVQARARQDALFDSMAEGVLVLDGQGRVQLANRAFTEMFGASDELRGKALLETLRSHEVAELVERAGREGRVLDHEMKLPGAGERWLEVNATAITGADRQRAATVLVFHDLTRLKRLERTREEFVANVSHELRTPLSMIKGYVETLLTGARHDPEVAERFLRIVERNAERLKLLIEDLLSISELESGRVTLNLHTVALRPVVQKVLDDFKGRVQGKNVTLTNDVPELPVRADAIRLEQVLANLVDNAIKYGRSGGCVAVAAGPGENGKVQVSVRDDGPGLPPEALERVFERFYRVDKARSREQGGTGLGLSIVKHIVQTHGGRAWARSEPGHGATFYFTLSAA